MCRKARSIRSFLSLSALVAASAACPVNADDDKVGPEIRCDAYGTPANKESAAWSSRNQASMRTGLAGTLVDDASGKVLAGLIVRVGLVQDIGKSDKDAQPKDFPSSYQIKTDAKGRFAFCLQPGQYGLIAEFKDGQSSPIMAPGAIMRQPGIFDSNGLPFFRVPPNKVLTVPKIQVHRPR
jgi:hypothetical protein